MALSEHQQVVSGQVINALKSGHKRIKLIGSAGVGKTYMVDELIKLIVKDRTILTHYNNGLIYVTAPTHKALSILKGKISSNVEFKTIHSALGLKLFTNSKTGERKFVADKGSPKTRDFQNCKILFIDEVSMLNTELLNLLENYMFPIIFIGDDKQINPVGEPSSPIFAKDFPTFELTEIVRQGAGNPIIELSRDIDLLFFKKPKLIDGKGYVYDNNRGQIISDLAEVNGTDEMKYLSWINADVDAMNEEVRKRRYGNPSKIEKQETIVFNAPFGEFYTNKEEKVLDVDIVTDFVILPNYSTKFDRNGEITTGSDKIKMKYYRVNDGFNVVHEHSLATFIQISKYLKECCAKYAWDWKGYFFFIEQFADIKYNHAITIHKSQGSTYKNNIINIQNVMFNKNAAERQRLLYTAITRASDLLILNNVK